MAEAWLQQAGVEKIMQFTSKNTGKAAVLGRALALAAGGLLAAQGALAQFSMVPAPLCAPPRDSAKEAEQASMPRATCMPVTRCGCTVASCNRCCTA
jgi:hypothetical protein